MRRYLANVLFTGDIEARDKRFVYILLIKFLLMDGDR